jgi:hypothetical protein
MTYDTGLSTATRLAVTTLSLRLPAALKRRQRARPAFTLPQQQNEGMIGVRRRYVDVRN